MIKFISVIALAACALTATARAATYDEARELYRQGNVPKAEAMYQAIVADQSASARDRSGAFRELARIAWLIAGEGQKAIAILAQSLPNDPDPCAAALLYGQALNDDTARSKWATKSWHWALRWSHSG